MKLIRLIFNLFICLLLSSCLYGQCLEGACSFERERIINSIKAYGEFWSKPDMTKESWRADWVGCGGMINGQYAGGAPARSSTEVMLEYQKKNNENWMPV